MTSLVEIVKSTGYQAFLERVKESDECYTHLAHVHSTVNGTFTGYVKFYPDELRQTKGLVNEACGYVLAKSLNLPLPRYGMILLILGKRLVEAHSLLRGRIDIDREYPAWVTEQVRGVPLHRHDIDALEGIRKWHKLPKLISFDDWVLNRDRSLDNMVRRGRNDFTVIDHGHIMGSLAWKRDLLTASTPFHHPFVEELWQGKPPPEISSKIVEAGKCHLATFKGLRMDLGTMLGVLLDNQDDKLCMESFLEQRAADSYHRIKSGLGLLI